ncbi:MAG: hypothetical protein A2W98_03910 [Bacteroidetes bacterium GWF2_33_38]|nr:MAG: hypothetical protein A2W98_03910 [Bacteroidetes bacterium GWF2_33_38]OFY76201.1 MAG: hypothetical protein A2265_10735 [Bacteroidetes bacterium RIFOXYA12_FULL_33_9]OFY92106.1 MAG: hypothetical protein A2236_07605 [Bacteroidetes bacterium RIFOXYA2_FULL_33_7]
MKTKNILIAALSTLIIFSFTSCSHKISFLTSSIVPAARGYVKVKKDDNKNYDIDIEISNLAEVDRLIPKKKVYIVWMISDEDITSNIGQIKITKKKLEASLEAISSSKPNKIFITSEEDARVQTPSLDIVLTTDKF